MGTEYRLVTERPAHQYGPSVTPFREVFPKRSYDHARQSLMGWHRDMERYQSVGLAPWHAHIETREVTDWERVDYTEAEAVPI